MSDQRGRVCWTGLMLRKGTVKRIAPPSRRLTRRVAKGERQSVATQVTALNARTLPGWKRCHLYDACAQAV